MKPVTAVVIGSVLIPVGLVMALTWLPSSIADALRYGSAGPCKEPIPNGSGCWTEVTAVVTGTREIPRSKHTDWVVGLEDDFGQQQVTVTHRSVFHDLVPSQSVSARFWEGQVALIHIPGRGDLPTEEEPGNKAGFATLTTAFVLLFGAFFFVGGLGVHRARASWTRSVDRDELGRDIFDMVAPPVQRWIVAIFVLAVFGIFGAVLAYAWFGAPIFSSALVSMGLGALLWAWSLHHRARTALASGKTGRKSR